MFRIFQGPNKTKPQEIPFNKAAFQLPEQFVKLIDDFIEQKKQYESSNTKPGIKK